MRKGQGFLVRETRICPTFFLVFASVFPCLLLRWSYALLLCCVFYAVVLLHVRRMAPSLSFGMTAPGGGKWLCDRSTLYRTFVGHDRNRAQENEPLGRCDQLGGEMLSQP